MASVIACVNEKGGVCKTSASVSLAWAVAELGYRVLVVDVDVQSHATEALAKEDADPAHPSLIDLIRLGPEDVVDVRSAIRPTRHPNINQLVGSRKMANAEIDLFTRHQRPVEVLKGFLKDVLGDYDYVFIDCPPSLNRVTMNAMVAADTILCPVDTSFYAYDSFKKILANVDSLRKTNVVEEDQAVWVLYTLWNPRTRIATDIQENIAKGYTRARAFKQTIPSLHVGRIAPAYKQTVFEYRGPDAKRLANAYRQVAKELVGEEAQAAS